MDEVGDTDGIHVTLKQHGPLFFEISRTFVQMDDVRGLATYLLDGVGEGGLPFVRSLGTLTPSSAALKVLEEWCNKKPLSSYGGALYKVLAAEGMNRVAAVRFRDILLEGATANPVPRGQPLRATSGLPEATSSSRSSGESNAKPGPSRAFVSTDGIELREPPGDPWELVVAPLYCEGLEAIRAQVNDVARACLSEELIAFSEFHDLLEHKNSKERYDHLMKLLVQTQLPGFRRFKAVLRRWIEISSVGRFLNAVEKKEVDAYGFKVSEVDLSTGQY